MVRREANLAKPGAIERIKDASSDPPLSRIIERYSPSIPIGGFSAPSWCYRRQQDHSRRGHHRVAICVYARRRRSKFARSLLDQV
jgi:hypothetical protein